MKRIIAITVGVLALAVPGSTLATSEPHGAFTTAAQLCGAENYLADAGDSIIFDGATSGDGLAELVCVLIATMPEWAARVVFNTTSSQGLNQIEANGIVALTTYHPDNGTFLVLYDAEAFQ